jgi:methionine-gamma-lyase
MSAAARIHTTVVHAGSKPGDFLGSLSVPVYRSSVYAFESLDEAAAVHSGQMPGYFYGRLGNPTQAALEEAVADLEGAEAALATASGMAAIATAVLTILTPGDELVATPTIYTTARELFDEFLTAHGVTVTYAASADASDVIAAFSPRTRAVYVESPSNPALGITDLRKVAAKATPSNITTVADNTFATPFNQNPIALGFDLVCHSATKYLGGHGDLIGGVLAGRADLINQARWRTTKQLGAVISADTAWLILRGLRTLAVRMERHNESAMAIATWLAKRDAVRAVNYPGLAGHPGHDIAHRQMRGYGGVLSFAMPGRESARRLVEAVRLCRLGVSFGDVATLIQPSAALTQAALTEQARRAANVPDGLVRLSVGLEDVDDIRADLDRALGEAGA